MRDEFGRLFADSMDTIRLPDQAKERLIALLSDPVAHNQGKVENNVEKECFTNKRSCKRAALLVLAAVMLMSALSVGVACWVSRFRSLEAELHMTEEQRRLAEESGLSAIPDNSRTAGEITSAKACGITVTVEQTITDRYFALLSFRLDGYSVPEGQYPVIGDIRIMLDGSPASWSGGFYNGIVSENGRAVSYDDGSPLEYRADGALLPRYAAADGTLTYHIMLMGNGGERPIEREEEGVIAGDLIGKTVEVRFIGIGSGDEEDVFPERDGTWNLRWTLTGSEEIRTVYPDRAVGDGGAVVAQAQISPISLRVLYRISQGIEEALIATADDDAVIPRLLGVRMKDGTLYPYLYMGFGTSGGALEQGWYEMRFAIDQILDTKNVDALLFLKSYPENGAEFAEENLYIVPLDEAAA